MDILQKIVLILAVSCARVVFAQPPHEQKTAASPNVASLGEYGDVPVSLFTGTVNISVPICEIKSYDYSMAVTLDYQTSGIRPDQHPGWLGIGWSLNAGGAIVRIVNDFPDDANEVRGSDGSLNFKELGYWFKHDLLNRADWSSERYLREVAQNGMLNVYDTAPDKFIFKFPGGSGCFYLDENGVWKVSSSRKISVKMLGFSRAPFKANLAQREFVSFGGFVLTTEDGVKYVFGTDIPKVETSEQNCPIDYSIGIFSQHNDYWYATAWHLRKIILPNNEEILFSYERENFICQMYRSTYNRLTIRETGSGFWGTEISCMSSDYPVLSSSYGGKLISPVYLKKIHSPDGMTVQFDRNRNTDFEMPYSTRIFESASYLFQGSEAFMYYVTEPGQKDIAYCIGQLNWQRLSSIYVSFDSGMQSSGTYIYQLVYGNKPAERLCLKELRKTFSYAPVCSYRFEYETPEKLPEYLSEETDHWGFANGVKVSDFGGLEDLRRYADKRRPDTASMRYGILKKIVYPTGGYSRFEYEPHTYGKVVNADRQSLRYTQEDSIAGGLRIKRIYNSDNGSSDGECLVKEYCYVNDYLGGGKRTSGILGGGIQYLFEDYTVRSFNASDTEAKMSIFSLQSILPSGENSCGSHIGYSEVTEKYANGAFIIYRFSNFDDGIFDNPPENVIQKSRTDYEPASERNMERGLLKSEEHYNSNRRITYRKSIVYEKDMSPDTAFVRAMTAGNYRFCGNGFYYYDEGVAWKIYTYTMREKSIEETFYESDGRSRSQVSDFSYNSDKQLIEKATHHFPSRISEKLSYKYLKSDNVCNLVSEKSSRTYCEDKVQAEEIRKYRYRRIGGTNCYVPIASQLDINGSTKESSCEYDNKGRLVSKKENNQTTVYVWGYRGRFVVAKIEGTTLERVENILGDLDVFASEDVPDYSKIDLLRKEQAQMYVISWCYDPISGIVSETDPSGRTVRYEYHKGMLSAKKDNDGNIIEAYKYYFKTQ